MARWYIIHAYSGFENKVRDSIIAEAERMGLSEAVEQVEVPTETVTEVKRGKKVQVERKFMPGYVLAKLTLTDVHVGEDALLGAADGSSYAECVRLSRLAWCALAVGTGQAVLDYVTPYVKEREAFGEPIAHRQSVAFMVADMAIELQAMRLLTYKAAGRAAAGKDFSHAVALARKQGADQAEVGASYEEGLSVTVRMGELESVERQRDRGLAITVYRDKRKGSASTTDFSPVSVEDTVRKALSIGSFTSDGFAAPGPKIAVRAIRSAAASCFSISSGEVESTSPMLSNP